MTLASSLFCFHNGIDNVTFKGGIMKALSRQRFSNRPEDFLISELRWSMYIGRELWPQATDL